MKKRLVFIAVLFFLVLNIVVERVHIPQTENGIVIFHYGEKNVQEALCIHDLSRIVKIFSGKILFEDMPSCGFSESVSINFDNRTEEFYLARDGCGLVYCKRANRYFKLSSSEKETLHSILYKYGFSFPCI